MPAANAYVQLAEDTARRITHSHTEWTGFLKTAARLYKYPYHEQLMIYAQRPEATACADYRVWNDRMRRYIRRGSKGIALLDVSGDEPKLRYVFDIADTGTRAASRPFSQWQLTEQNEEAARRALEDGYDVTGSLEKQIHAAVQQMVMNQWLDHRREILGIVDGSYLEGYDEFNVGASFRKAAAVSAEYALLSRCGRNPDERFVHEDFLPIFDWNTPEAVTVLGTAVSEMSEEVLRQLEIYIRNFERSQEHEPDHLSAKRRLSDSQPDRGENGETAGSVRTDAEGIPAEAPAHDVSFPASTERKDDVIPFEQMGIDRLYVDEAQSYKNLFLTTKMRNVAGLSTSEAQKASDMLMKCRYLDELTGGRGVVFATGTSVSNSMTELFTMMRYLQHDMLVQKGLAHFDCWASPFGETVTAIELAPEGYTLIER